MTKRIISALLVIVTVFGTLSFAASAAGSTFDTATSMSMGKTYSGTITDNHKDDFYKFTLSASGRVELQFSGSIGSAYLYIYTADGKKIWNDDNAVSSSNQATLYYEDTLDLNSGTYYFQVHERYSGRTGNYNLILNYKDAKESFKETSGDSNDNYFEYANSISLGSKYNGQIATGDKDDFYKFTLPSSGRINLKFSGNIGSAYLYIYTADGKKIWNDDDAVSSSNQATLNYQDTVDLTSGTYYFQVHERYSGRTGNYTFSIGTGKQTAVATTRPTVERPTQVPTTVPIQHTNAPEEPIYEETTVYYTEPETYVRPEIDNDTVTKLHDNDDFTYTIINNYIVIFKYTGSSTYVIVPMKIGDYVVKGIGDNAFNGTKAEEVEIPDCVTQFGTNAFGEENEQSIKIRCNEGSAAHSYANQNGVSYTLNNQNDSDGENKSFLPPISERSILILFTIALAIICGVCAVAIMGRKRRSDRR